MTGHTQEKIAKADIEEREVRLRKYLGAIDEVEHRRQLLLKIEKPPYKDVEKRLDTEKTLTDQDGLINSSERIGDASLGNALQDRLCLIESPVPAPQLLDAEKLFRDLVEITGRTPALTGSYVSAWPGLAVEGHHVHDESGTTAVASTLVFFPDGYTLMDVRQAGRKAYGSRRDDMQDFFGRVMRVETLGQEGTDLVGITVDPVSGSREELVFPFSGGNLAHSPYTRLAPLPVLSHDGPGNNHNGSNAHNVNGYNHMAGELGTLVLGEMR